MKIKLELEFTNDTQFPENVALIKLYDTIKNFGCVIIKANEDGTDKEKEINKHLNIKE